MNEAISDTARNVIYLTSCALHCQKPDEGSLGEADWASMYRMAKRHSMTAVVCTSLESAGLLDKMEPSLAKKWRDDKNKSIRKIMLMDEEYKKIAGFMESEGIWYMPLKGFVTKDLYPACGMRQMSDYDILTDPAGEKKLRKYMEEQGYDRKSSETSAHDAYYKAPVYNFELHRSLFGEYHDKVWYEYYKNVKERLIPDGGCRYRFSNADFYVYMTAHACKHYKNAGTGLRSLMDFYVYCSEMNEKLDWDYIRAELEKLGLSEFEKMSNELAFLLFSEPDAGFVDRLDDKKRESLGYFIGSGTYGTTENRVEKQLHTMQSDNGAVSRRTKLHYLARRLFPDMAWFKGNAPFCYRHRWAIPFYLVFRAVRGLIFKRKRISGEIKAVRKVK